MIRFGKPDGSPFDFDYTGNIHAFDAGNDTIAVCLGETEIGEMETEDGVEPISVTGDPSCWDDWNISIKLDNEEEEELITRSLAAAYSALHIAQKLLSTLCEEEEEEDIIE